MGADVIKVERPRGDDLRGNQVHRQPTPRVNYVYEVDNRGKRSMVLDLTKDGGTEVLLKLANRCDVFVTNLSAARARRLGSDYQTIREASPSIVYARVTGYGSVGPEAERPGFDSTAYWARSGVMALMGEVGTPIVQSRAGQGDHPTGVTLLAATLAALRLRDRTGEAQFVDVSLQRTGVWSLATDLQQVLNVQDFEPVRFDRAAHSLLTRNAYETADSRWLMLTMHDVPRYWPRLCEALDRRDWSADPRFASTVEMLEHGTEIAAELEATFRSRDLAFWSQRLDAARCVWAPAALAREVVADPQLRATNAFVQLTDVDGHAFEVIAAPFTIEGADVRPRSRAPTIGEHSYEILIEAGLTPDQVADFAAREVFG
jgi:crotonobetainyl-CoA:carnitine CoA-transferase CaiB-like acyl-CoA transferase